MAARESTVPRSVFMGTPAFAVPALEAVAELTEIVAVVCQPDRRAGRGLEIVEPATKIHARTLGIDVHQPTKMRDGTFAAWLRALQVDVAVVVAYGRILPREVLLAPRRGCVNVHASLLPRHRGAAPIQWAIMSGDRETGVCLMQMDEGLDTGPVLATLRTPIGADETTPELSARLSLLAADLLRAELDHFVRAEREPTPQDAAGATLAPPLTREMSPIDWRLPASAIHDRVRALQPWPLASTLLGARRLIVHRTTMANPPRPPAGAPGEVVDVSSDALWVSTGDGRIGLLEVQLEGRKHVPVRAFLSGHPVRIGTVLGQS